MGLSDVLIFCVCVVKEKNGTDHSQSLLSQSDQSLPVGRIFLSLSQLQIEGESQLVQGLSILKPYKYRLWALGKTNILKREVESLTIKCPSALSSIVIDPAPNDVDFGVDWFLLVHFFQRSIGFEGSRQCKENQGWPGCGTDTRREEIYRIHVLPSVNSQVFAVASLLWEGNTNIQFRHSHLHKLNDNHQCILGVQCCRSQPASV